MTTDRYCADCGQPFTPTLDRLDLCPECLRIAVLITGSGETRIATLATTSWGEQ